MRPHNNPNWTVALQKATGIKHRDIAPTLAPEIQPVVIVDDIRGALEADVPPLYCGVSVSTTSGAANYAQLDLFNPLSSGRLVRMKRVMLSVLTANTFVTGRFITALVGGASTGFYCNRRVTGVPACQVGSGSALALQAGDQVVGLQVNVAASPLIIPVDYVLDEGTGIVFQTMTPAINTLVLQADWDEIPKGQRG